MTSATDPTHVEADSASADGFAALARALQAQDTVQHTLEVMCKLAVHLIDGGDHAGITVMGRDGKFDTPASSDGVPRTVDRTQYSTGEGPCVDAVREHKIVEMPDLASDNRWPEFARRTLAETPVRSMLCFRLFVADDTLGALNFYSETPGSFPDAIRPLGGIFAAHAAIAFEAARNHDEVENLNRALASSRRIGAAIGILMSRRAITEDQGFELLRSHSQVTHTKLRDVADAVVLTGDLSD
jgi:GAF domain-containing protein